MTVALRKLDIEDFATLEKLVVDHIENIEPGLAVIDSRLLLGHSSIDLVAQDRTGALVLIALGFRADESMLLRIVDAYSWCLEYPEAIGRHYPTVTLSEERPPRVIFVMARVPESFHRRLKQLSFPAVDAVEFHHLDVDGVPAVFFDPIARIRRASLGVPAPEIEPRPAATPAPASNGHAARPRVIEIPASAPRAYAPALRPEAAASAVAVSDEVPTRMADVSTSDLVAALTAEPAAPAVAPVAVAAETDDASVQSAVEAPEIAEPDAAGATAATEVPPDQRVSFSEAARAAKVAEDLGIQLPKEGALTRQWVDFLNQLAR